jgi:hypothetical protein
VGTFAWSDNDLSYADWTGPKPLSPAKAQTFLVRSLSGMAINTESAPAGVNVHIGGAVQIDGQQKFTGACTGALAGTFDTENGCYYYCDGSYRQAFNVAFNKGGANPDAQSCDFD